MTNVLAQSGENLFMLYANNQDSDQSVHSRAVWSAPLLFVAKIL